MPYRKQGAGNYFTRVITRDGRRPVKSTGTSLLTVARAMEAWLRDVLTRRDMAGVLDAIADDRITLAKAYALGESDAARFLTLEAETARDTDLTPLLTEWERAKLKSARGAVSAAKYVRQIRVLFPMQPWRRSTLTVPRIAKALDALPCTDPTRNRYKAALSGFCTWLVRRGELPSNPVQQLKAYPENAGRTTWYHADVTARILNALPMPFRALESLMAATGMDWSDCTRLRVEDVNLSAGTVRCRGSKTEWRNREVRWTTPTATVALEDAMRGKLPQALVFEIGHREALKAHHAATMAARATASTLHDWRHTYAVNALKRGLPATVVAHQLGHQNAHLVWSRYGRFVPEAKDYRLAGSATEPATSQEITDDTQERSA